MKMAANVSHYNHKCNSLRHPSTSCPSPVTKSRPTSRPCCRVLECMGITSSTAAPNIHQRLTDLEKAMERVTEENRIYKAKLEKLKDYLRYYQQTAEENGFLYLIPPYPNQSPLSVELMPRLVPITNPDPRLSIITHQAKINGWFIEPDEIDVHEEVGQGSTAHIHRGTWHGIDVAVKCLKADFFNLSENSYLWFAQELEILSRQRHPFVLHMLGACLQPPRNAWVVTEFLSGRTLKEWLHGQGGRCRERLIPLPPLKLRLEKALEIAQAMQYLHEQKPRVLHRDLKPSNIFLDDAGHVKVADFGFARFLVEEEKANTGETGYFCPFLFVFEVLLLPLPEDDNGQLQELVELIRNAWHENASVRPSFTMIT